MNQNLQVRRKRPPTKAAPQFLNERELVEPQKSLVFQVGKKYFLSKPQLPLLFPILILTTFTPGDHSSLSVSAQHPRPPALHRRHRSKSHTFSCPAGWSFGQFSHLVDGRCLVASIAIDDNHPLPPATFFAIPSATNPPTGLCPDPKTSLKLPPNLKFFAAHPKTATKLCN